MNYINKYLTNKSFVNHLPNVVTSKNRIIMKADSGATTTYLKKEHAKFLRNLQSLQNGPKAVLPNNTTIAAAAQGDLPLHPFLTPKALIYPQLKSDSLLSIGQLCDDGCTAVFDKENLNIYKQNELVLKGNRNKQDGLWDVHFPVLKANYIIQKDKSKHDLGQYLHGCAFSPVISTFQMAINKGNFITWPGIDDLKFKKLLDSPIATTLGHLDQERSNLQSTKLIENDDAFPPPIPAKTRNCFFQIIDMPKKTAYTDQTGRFPCQSTRGNNYIFICYDYDGSTILPVAIKK